MGIHDAKIGLKGPHDKNIVGYGIADGKTITIKPTPHRAHTKQSDMTTYALKFLLV
jgi:hypothetical protein